LLRYERSIPGVVIAISAIRSKRNASDLAMNQKWYNPRLLLGNRLSGILWAIAQTCSETQQINRTLLF